MLEFWATFLFQLFIIPSIFTIFYESSFKLVLIFSFMWASGVETFLYLLQGSTYPQNSSSNLLRSFLAPRTTPCFLLLYPPSPSFPHVLSPATQSLFVFLFIWEENWVEI